MSEIFDFLSYCQPGMTLFTGDRRSVTVTAVDREAGLIHGELQMFGRCSWPANGLWADAPCGASGPMDLMPPADGPAAERKSASIVEQLADGANRHFCCD